MIGQREPGAADARQWPFVARLTVVVSPHGGYIPLLEFCFFILFLTYSITCLTYPGRFQPSRCNAEAFPVPAASLPNRRHFSSPTSYNLSTGDFQPQITHHETRNRQIKMTFPTSPLLLQALRYSAARMGNNARSDRIGSVAAFGYCCAVISAPFAGAYLVSDAARRDRRISSR